MVAEPDWSFVYGDPDSPDREILRSVVGSGVHGIAIAGTDDHDEMGIYIEKPDNVFAVSDYYMTSISDKPQKRRQDYTARTQPEGARSGPGDTDLVIYSLRKYLELAIKGNPTALLPLFAPEESLVKTTWLGDQLRDCRSWFLSEYAVERFLGYMHAQHERMLGQGRQSRVPNRPELIEQYGWDVKYGSHALRLAYEGREIAFEGNLTLPLREDERERVLAVKRGEVGRDEVSAEITAIEKAIRRLLDAGDAVVRPLPDFDAIQAWSIKTHLDYWNNLDFKQPS